MMGKDKTRGKQSLLEMQPVLCRIRFLVVSFLMVLLVTASPAAYANMNDARVLQDRAIARMDRYIDHFRRTFDQIALRDELTEAALELERSVPLFQAAGAREDAARSMVKLGDIGRYLSDWDSAIRTYERAAREAGAAGAGSVECKALLGSARAHLYGKKGAGGALELVRRALPLAQQVKDASYRFDAWDMMAQVQIAEGNYVGAADSINHAFAVVGTIKDDRDLYYGYLDRADIYQHFAEKCTYDRDFKTCLDAVERARRDYESAYAAARRLGWDGLAQQARGFSASLEDREQLLRLQQKMHEEILQEKVFSPKMMNDVLVSERFTTGANPQLPSVLAWIESQGGLPPLTDARGAYIKGLLNESAGQRDEAMGWYLRAVELLEQDRQLLYDERARGTYVEDKVEFYYSAMLHLLDRQRYQEAFDLMERSRSRVMSDLLATKSIALSSPQERSLYGSMLQLRSETAQIQTCLFTVRGGKEPDSSCQMWHKSETEKRSTNRGAVLDDDSGSRLNIDIAELEAVLKERQSQYDTILDRMVKNTPKLARLVTSQPASLDAVKKVLAHDGSEMIAYVVLESQLIIWHIGPESLHVRSVFLPRSTLKHKIEHIRQSLVDPKHPYDQKTARELYLYLIAPVLPWIKSDHLVIVPHEDLHYLPFQALQTERDDRYLGEIYQISYAPSAMVLATLAGPSALARPEVLAVADPSLQYAPDEVRAIGKGFSGLVVTETLANEADVKKLMAGKGLVHLAVHGKFASDEPLLSYLSLKEGKGDDGKLTAAEMYGLSLDSAKLVVLSACETGSVRATHANEVMGMVRGLIFAGADALLLSSWEIDDKATAEWTQSFYAAAVTEPLAAAARTAIRDLKAKPGYQHPYYWSPFLLIGR
ncbi:MAG: CHAT domain-containing protein [Nitrospira sp.]|nr:MAG: CHAT domain-containing protein [Nitrospira sp.]